MVQLRFPEKLLEQCSAQQRAGLEVIFAAGLDFGTGRSSVVRMEIVLEPYSPCVRSWKQLRFAKLPLDDRREPKDIPSECAYASDSSKSFYGEGARRNTAAKMVFRGVKLPLYCKSSDALSREMARRATQVRQLREKYEQSPLADSAHLWPAADFLSWYVPHALCGRVERYYVFAAVPSLLTQTTSSCDAGVAVYRTILNLAGIESSRLSFVEEVECGAHSCLEEDQETMTQFTNSFVTSTRLAYFIDSGAGTMDRVSYRLVSRDPLQFEETGLAEAQLAGPADVIAAFEKKYRAWGVAAELRDAIIESHLEIAKQQFVTHMHLFGDASSGQECYEYVLGGGTFVLTSHDMAELFEHWMSMLEQFLQGLSADAQFFCLGGGSTAPLFREAMRRRFGDGRVHFPTVDHSTAISRGCLLSGLTVLIARRIAAVSAGLSRLEDFTSADEGHEDEVELIPWEDEDGRIAYRRMVRKIRLVTVAGGVYDIHKRVMSLQMSDQIARNRRTKAARRLPQSFRIPQKLFFTADRRMPRLDGTGSFFYHKEFQEFGTSVEFLQDFTPAPENFIQTAPKPNSAGIIELQWTTHGQPNQLGLEIYVTVTPELRWPGGEPAAAGTRSKVFYQLHRGDMFVRGMSLGDLPLRRAEDGTSRDPLRYPTPPDFQLEDLSAVNRLADDMLSQYPEIGTLGAFVMSLPHPSPSPSTRFTWGRNTQETWQAEQTPASGHHACKSSLTQSRKRKRCSIDFRSSPSQYADTATVLHAYTAAPSEYTRATKYSYAETPLNPKDRWPSLGCKRLGACEPLGGITRSHYRISHDDLSGFPLQLAPANLGFAARLVAGQQQLYLIIPPECRDELEMAVQRAYPGAEPLNMKCSQFISHQHVSVDLDFLEERGIDFHTTYVQSGDLVVVLPGAYCQIINMGPNVAESTNFAPSKWELGNYSFCGEQACGHTKDILRPEDVAGWRLTSLPSLDQDSSRIVHQTVLGGENEDWLKEFGDDESLKDFAIQLYKELS